MSSDDAECGNEEPRLEDTSLRPCPKCGRPIARRTIIGPTEAIAGPCGCRVTPKLPTPPNAE
ncbi:hypothetical protein AB7C87_11365 [Natrarchaeobius sp. A-rgal3]|uniref:hypothetical protein n=1 Tax=Natrarchaeobius versutus TaxID=1679078 RepID=UPI0035100CBA